jgi:hypothetical protein
MGRSARQRSFPRSAYQPYPILGTPTVIFSTLLVSIEQLRTIRTPVMRSHTRSAVLRSRWLTGVLPVS